MREILAKRPPCALGMLPAAPVTFYQPATGSSAGKTVLFPAAAFLVTEIPSGLVTGRIALFFLNGPDKIHLFHVV